MSWLRRWRRSISPNDAERQALEDWVRRRFFLASSDPMTAIIGAFGRLADAGLTTSDATETVLRIMREVNRTGAHERPAQACRPGPNTARAPH